jgi:hypothetical protein
MIAYADLIRARVFFPRTLGRTVFEASSNRAEEQSVAGGLDAGSSSRPGHARYYHGRHGRLAGSIEMDV